MTDANQRTWATFVHLGALSKFIGVPFGHLLVPLVLWLLKREESAFVDEHGKEALNFQISMTLYLAVVGVMVVWLFLAGGLAAVAFVHNPVVLVMAILSTALVPSLIFLALLVLDIVVVIVSALKASAGLSSHYPLAIHFLK